MSRAPIGALQNLALFQRVTPGAYPQIKTGDSRQRLVRHGYGPEGDVLNGIFGPATTQELTDKVSAAIRGANA